MPNNQQHPTNSPVTDRLAIKAWHGVLTYKVCILSTLLTGLAAHLFFLSQKLITFDDPLFSYGHGYDSGRWGIDILRHLVPPFSMPWFNGMVSLLLLSVTMVIIVRLFNIRRPLLQALLPAVVATSGLQVSIFLFMCASTPYAVSLLLAVLSVWHISHHRRHHFVMACAELVFSLSLYQAYVTVPIGLLLAMASMRLLIPSTLSRTVIWRWVKLVGGYLLIAIAVYFAITLGLIHYKGGLATASNYDYAMSTGLSVPLIEHLTGVFTKFLEFFTHGSTGLISTPMSVLLHALLLLCTIGEILRRQWQQGQSWCLLAQILIIFIALPLTINLFWLLLAPAHWNTLTIYAFMAIYALAVAIADQSVKRPRLYDIVALCMAGITACNIYFANRTYLQVFIYDTNNTAFYEDLVTRIKQMPELQSDTQLSLVGNANQYVNLPDKAFGYNGMRGQGPLTNTYSRREFIIHHLGFGIPILTSFDQLQLQLEADQRVQAMPIYPHSGSIQAIDSVIVVKLGDCPTAP